MKKLLLIALLALSANLQGQILNNVANFDQKSEWIYTVSGNPFVGSTKIALLNIWDGVEKGWSETYGNYRWQRKNENIRMIITKTNNDEIETYFLNAADNSKNKGCNEMVYGIIFDNESEVHYIKGQKTSIYFNHKKYNSYRNSLNWGWGDYYPSVKLFFNENLLNKFKKHSKFYITQTEGCSGRKVFKYSLKGSTTAINKVLGINVKSNTIVSKYANYMKLSTANPFHLEAYVDAFIKDAKIYHNLTLSPGKVFVKFEQLDGAKLAVAANMNKENVVVLVDPENWERATPIKRWYIMYHELGHDILNFRHGVGGPMMNPTTAGIDFTYLTFYKHKNILFNSYKK